ncbi:MAG: two-component regulator propeller domain-containing protein [Oscillospiraceae bacterium]
MSSKINEKSKKLSNKAVAIIVSVLIIIVVAVLAIIFMPKTVNNASFASSIYKHTTNGGIKGSAPYNTDAITGATLTIEGPGVKSSVPLSTRELETTDKGLSKGKYKDNTGTFNYEGMDLYYLLNKMTTGENGIVLTDTAKSVVLKDCNRKTIATFSLSDVKKAHDDGNPILIAYGVGTKNNKISAPFVFNATTKGDHSAGFVAELNNEDGCLKLVYNLNKYGSNKEYTKFTNCAYIYVGEGNQPGFKHTKKSYGNSKYSNYVVTFKGSELGKEVTLTVKDLEKLVQYDKEGKVITGGLGYTDSYSLANSNYWYVNEYEGLDLFKTLVYLGIDENTARKSQTPVSFVASDGYISSAAFTLSKLSNPDLFKYYEKNSADDDTGTYKEQKEDLIATGYPVMLAYGVNEYPYVISNSDKGYMSGLTNSGGPMRVIFGKQNYHDANGSNQIQYVSEVIVGTTETLYNTHKYTNNESQKALANQGVSIVINNSKGTQYSNATMTVGQIEDLIYGKDVSKNAKKASQVKAKYEVSKGDKAFTDIYEGVSLEYLLSEAVKMPGQNGTVTFSNGIESITMDMQQLFAKGYNTTTGESGLKSVIAFAKNGSPLVASKQDAGYVDEMSFSYGNVKTKYAVKNSGGPLSLIIPSSKKSDYNGKILSNITSITVNLEEDKYTHLEGDYNTYAGNTIKFFGKGLSNEVSYKLSELEGMQKFAVTKDYSLRNKADKTVQIRYRGIVLYDILSEIGLNSNADKIIVHSGDYKQEFSVADIKKSCYVNSQNKSINDLKVMLAFGSSSVANKDKKDGLPLVSDKSSNGYSSLFENDGGAIKLVVPQTSSSDANSSRCINNVTEIEVTAAELDGWKHNVNDIYSDFLDYEIQLIVQNDDSKWTAKYTLAELESMNDLVVRDDYSVLEFGACEGIDLWKFIIQEAGSVKGVKSPVSINVIATDGYTKDILSIFGQESLGKGIADANGNRKKIIMAYANKGVPLVDSESHEGYTGLIGNGFGPIRLVTEGNQGSSLKYFSKIIVKVEGKGKIENKKSKIKVENESDKAEKRSFKTFPATGKSGELGLGSVRTVQMDSNGGLWVGTNGSGAYYKPKDSKTFTISTLETDGYKLESPVVQAIAIDKDGGVWFSQSNSYSDMKLNKGVAYLAPNGKITYYNTDKKGTIPNNYVQEITVDKKGNVWFGSFGGLTRFNPSTKEWKTWTMNDGLPAMSVSCIETADNGVWVGCYPNSQAMTGPFSGGYAFLDTKTDKISFKYVAGTDEDDCNDSSLLADFWVRDIAVDKDGGAWIVRSGSYPYLANVGGRVDYVSKDGKITHYKGAELLADKLKDNSEIRMVEVDPDGGIWFGCWNGVFYCEKIGTVKEIYNTENESWKQGKNLDNIYSLGFFGETLYTGSNGGVTTCNIDFKSIDNGTDKKASAISSNGGGIMPMLILSLASSVALAGIAVIRRKIK